MNLYQATFAVLVVTSLGLAWRHHKHELQSPPPSEENLEDGFSSHGDPNRFRRMFLVVYGLVMGSDWLQGAYVYTLYKDEKNLAESTVAGLFTCGFLAAAISALFLGSLADKYGRRLACLVFCVTYAVGCLTKISNNVIVLFIGRLLGGASTTLMYSVFESWMVTEYFAWDLGKSHMSLDSMFGIMTTLNSIVAIISGVVGEGLVAATGTKVSPFLVAVLCLAWAFWFIVEYWVGDTPIFAFLAYLQMEMHANQEKGENYGDSAELNKLGVPEKSTIKLFFKDKRIMALSFISCCFEGSMYIFVFYWSAAMKSAHALTMQIAGVDDATEIPFGIIFASFMAAMMLGSLAFTFALSAPSSSQFAIAKFLTPPYLLTLSVTGACLSFLLPVLSKVESTTFWSFCLFEACIGIYYPSMSAQRAVIVDDGIRAKIYCVLRIPLNIFVAVALTATVEGDEHRDKVFVICAGLLLLAALAAGYFPGVKAADADYEIAHGRSK